MSGRGVSEQDEPALTASPGSPGRETYEIRFPDPVGVDQDEESCEVVLNGTTKRIRFHDYGEIYSIPGLYEQLFYEELRCQSPQAVRELLADTLDGSPLEGEGLRVLDIGAGNGMLAEQLGDLGPERIVGVDILEEAAEAAERDRPDLYDDYYVVDLTDVPAPVDDALQEASINCLTTAAALGFGDIPPEAFTGAYDYVADGGLVAMTIKSEFIEGTADSSGFARLIDAAVEEGSLELRAQRRFTHRLSAAGEPILYDAIVAEKAAELPTLS